MFRLRILPKTWCRTLYSLQNRKSYLFSDHLLVKSTKQAAQHLWTKERFKSLRNAVILEKEYCTNETQLSEAEYEDLADETLDSLTEMFEDIQERFDVDPEFDVTFNSGVLTVKISSSWGTYVINKQTPNRQIWFSSPKSGPKRYDYIDGRWIYKHDGGVMHELLNKEISEALRQNLDFTVCSYGGR